jgi:uncharacterized protein YrzB (UPF0473 family)
MIKELENNEMSITREDGTEDIVKILFYYENEERKKKFYFLYEEDKPEDVFVMASEDGESLMILTDEEMAEAEEMFDTYMNDPKIAEAKK